MACYGNSFIFFNKNGPTNYDTRCLGICGSRTTSFFVSAVPAVSEIDLWAAVTICIIG
jgi:hypothetical protein